MDVEDNAFLALRPARGGFAWLHASWTEWKNLFSFEMALERCKIELNGLGGSYGPERCTRLRDDRRRWVHPDRDSWTWPPGDTSWHARARRRRRPARGPRAVGATLDDAIAAMPIIDEAYRS